ncbi:hypothetical protein, partial [Pseudomonas sp. GL-B-12]
GLIAWDFHVSPDLNPSNRPVRTRMPGGVAGVRSMKAVPYADCLLMLARCPPRPGEISVGSRRPFLLSATPWLVMLVFQKQLPWNAHD